MAEAEERMVREVEERVRREAEQEMRRQMEERERTIAEKMERWADHTHLQQLSYIAQAYVYNYANHAGAHMLHAPTIQLYIHRPAS